MEERTVILIGAGVAGLACARELTRRGVSCLVLERSRGVGGRCATRRIEGQAVDHGLALLHARTAEFADALAELPASGRIDGWPSRVIETRLACQPEAFGTEQRRHARREGVNAFPKHLAEGLDIRLQSPVVALEPHGSRVVAVTEEGRRYAGEFVVSAGSLAQSLRLVTPLMAGVESARETLAALATVEQLPSFVVLAGYPLDGPDPRFDAWHPLETVMLQSIYVDSNKRTAPKFRVLALHSRTGFARARLAAPPEEWAGEMLWEAGEVLGEWAARPLWHQAHAWRSGRVRRGDQTDRPAVFHVPGGGIVMLIGDAFGSEAGLEGAYLSGVAAGEQLARAPERLKLVGG